MKLKIIIIIITTCTVLGIILTIIFNRNDNTKMDWIKDLNYDNNQIHNFTTSFFNPCPLIPVIINGKEVNLEFDTGNGEGILLTTAINGKVDYYITGKITNFNADGSYRGDGISILLKSVNVFGEKYSNIKLSLSDWRMYGVLKSNGTIGLEYFRDKVVTLDYRNKKIAVSNKPIDYNKLQNDKYIILPLIKSSASEESDLLFFEGEVNGKKSTIYLDTGSSRSFINLEDNNNTTSAEVKLGDKKYEINELKSDKIKFTGKFKYPLRLAINSDILNSKHFVITIDKVQNKLIIY